MHNASSFLKPQRIIKLGNTKVWSRHETASQTPSKAQGHLVKFSGANEANFADFSLGVNSSSPLNSEDPWRVWETSLHSFHSVPLHFMFMNFVFWSYEFFKVRKLKSKCLSFEAPSVAISVYKIQWKFQEFNKEV